MKFANVKVIVFDLDGTLYDDTHHFDYQAERLKIRLPKEKHELFARDYALHKEGKHPLKIGRVYDCLNDLILVQMENIVQEAYRWNGKKLSDEQVKQLYKEPIELNFTTMLSIGDPWWSSISIGVHYGLDGKACQEAFLETREYMMGPQFEMNPITGLKETIESLRPNCKFVLLTNSPEVDSEVILEKLRIKDLFDLKIFNGQKPKKTLEHFQHIKEFFQVRYEQILSVGDNWVNEIRPVIPLGCKTILIDPYHIGEQAAADLIVTKMTEALPTIQSCGQK